jgi:hypothetical protein
MEDPHIWKQVFSSQNALLAFFGAMGGAVRSAVLKTTWKEGLRVIFIGSATAFGVGVLAPVILKPWIGDLPDGLEGALGTLCASAFLIGLISVTMIERFIAGKRIMGDEE